MKYLNLSVLPPEGKKSNYISDHSYQEVTKQHIGGLKMTHVPIFESEMIVRLREGGPVRFTEPSTRQASELRELELSTTAINQHWLVIGKDRIDIMCLPERAEIYVESEGRNSPASRFQMSRLDKPRIPFPVRASRYASQRDVLEELVKQGNTIPQDANAFTTTKFPRLMYGKVEDYDADYIVDFYRLTLDGKEL